MCFYGMRNSMTENPNLPTLQGERWRATHRASVIAILGAEAPIVSSRGSQFFNVDRWTLRFLVREMCDWAKKNPAATPLRTDIANWVHAANSEKLQGPRQIVIAATPTKLSPRVLLALIGGGYHEALHTLLSCRRDLKLNEVADVILPRWAKVKDWSRLYGLLQDWNNIIEDIRIEREGIHRFPGIWQKMCELQDFILEQEAADYQKTVGTHGKNAARKPLSVIAATFRDLGLGYETQDQARAFAEYKEQNFDAFDIVDRGPLRPLLDESIALGPEDVLGCLRVAMDVIVELSHLVDPEDMKQANNRTTGTGRTDCPNCNAPGKDLVVRPLSNGKGGTVPGRGVLTCTRCGWQETVDLSGESTATKQLPDPDNTPRFESIPINPDMKLGGMGDEEGSNNPSENDSGDKSNKKTSKGTGDGGDNDKSNNAKDNNGEIATPHTNPDHEKEPPNGAGGHQWDPERVKAWEVVAEEALNAAVKGDRTGLLDMASALRDAFGDARKKEDRDCGFDEAVWRPYAMESNTVQFVEPSNKGKVDDMLRAKVLLGSVRLECLYLRTRLRSIIRAVEQRAVVHGTRRGIGISERMLVESLAAIRGGRPPNRAYYTVGEQMDTSIAAVIVMDESGSMTDKLQDATKLLMALTEPLDFLGAKTMVVGFRDGISPPRTSQDLQDSAELGCHRVAGVHIDIFKSFEERFVTIQWRFANTRGVGGTPMSDGVQFGLDHLNHRKEAHRILFVVTDGDPDTGHEPVIRRQHRIAKEAGINVIGVGVGVKSQRVMRLFPDHVWDEHISNLPTRLVKKLNEVLDFRGIKRYHKMKKTG